jgi:hypothetical protein
MNRMLTRGVLIAFAILASAASAQAQSVVTQTDSMDDSSLWTRDGTGSRFFSSGFENNVQPASAPNNAWVKFTTGSTTSDWGTLGRNVRFSTIFPGARKHTCAASIKVTGSGSFEAIDTATWTYLTAPVSFTGTNGTYKTITLPAWNPTKPDMFFRVGIAGGGSTHWVRFDDLVVQCVR